MRFRTFKGYIADFCRLPIHLAGNSFPGIYAFVSVDALGRERWIYIGQSIDVKDRLLDHEKWKAIMAYQPTHCYVARVESEVDRDDVEQCMIVFYSPLLNVQHKREQSLYGLFGTRPSKQA
ncbi:hypothetical protein C7S18_13985 [Ahniella affigens]|uniref:GIY-YIG domain-containing protein n=1 Tax=Ahniella affigens TaxID=2021234 RepID=A0A2P1PTR4_9GAMM|nr:hypothetical protein [Ahniella affigens]AVP98234.1 hypothetical protein C7S18_13985 [Ahniella affigens]